MKITRRAITIERQKVIRFLKHQKEMGCESDVYKAIEKVCRVHNVHVNYDRTSLLNNIELIFDAKEKHWAETDGQKIWLNTWHDYNTDLLYKTLLHEVLHGMILRNGLELSEYCEHKIMGVLDPTLL